MMKKLLVLLLFPLFSLTNLKASHQAGGEFTWKCTDDGRYLFYLKFYRDCTGINVTYQNEIVEISGNPLPANGMSSLTMHPDTAFWRKNSNGKISNNCNSQSSNQLSCASGGNGLLEFYSYRSDTITLTGIPPQSGWKFDYWSFCCYPDRDNTNPINHLNIRSIMYPNVNGDSINTCLDNSPYFAELPNYMFCRGQLSSFNHKALDIDGDSLSYKSIKSYDFSGGSAPRVPIVYKPGYTELSPTPNQSFNVNNLPYTLNASTGDVRFKAVSGTGSATYTTNTLVTAWRDGVRIASVSRATPISVFDCDTLANGQTNTAPYVEPPFPLNPTGNPFHGVIAAGSTLNLGIVIRDSTSSFFGANPQSFKIVPIGVSLSKDLVNKRNCLNPQDTSCATFTIAPAIDSSVFPSVNYYLTYTVSYLTLNWNTDCNHLNSDGSAKTHYFLIKATDDHCPIPATVYKTISITVEPPATGCNLITGVKSKLEFQNSVTLYPNPTEGYLHLSGLEQNEGYNLEIRNIQGKLVSQEQIVGRSESVQLNVEGDAGIYFIQLTNEKGERANLKIIKQ